MILPNNGKVVIIDDSHEEVKHLMHALTKERMPFLFFKDQGGDDLPPENYPIENVRLVFLDLDLGLGVMGETEMIRIVQNRLVRIIKKNTPYVLVMWSNHEDRLSMELFKDFNTTFNEYKPIATCSLDKSVIRRTTVNIVETIRNELKNCLAPLESFNAFLLWESIVNKSSGELVDSFTKIFDFNPQWDNNVKALFYRLAKANVGDTKVQLINDSEKLMLALETINSAFIDIVEKNIRSESKLLNLRISEVNSNITASNLVHINTKLHLLTSTSLEHFQPGNIYFPPLDDDNMIEEIVKNAFIDKGGSISNILASKPRVIKVDVTPVCDYSQDKGYTRLLSAILIHEKFYELKKSPSKAFIYNLCPVLNIEGANYYPVFDYRYFKSVKREFIESHFSKPIYKIRLQLLTDLQAGLSSHINRPGIISVI